MAGTTWPKSGRAVCCLCSSAHWEPVSLANLQSCHPALAVDADEEGYSDGNMQRNARSRHDVNVGRRRRLSEISKTVTIFETRLDFGDEGNQCCA